MALKALFSSKLVIAVVGLLVVGGGIGGAFALGVLETPSVERIDNSFGEVNESTTEIQTELVVNNPNPVGGNLDVAIEYTVTMNGIQMAEGDREGVPIEKGNSTIRFTTYMDNERIPAWWVSHVNEGEYTELSVDAIVHTGLFGQSVEAPDVTEDVPTDIIGAFNSDETRELNANREPVIQDPVLYLNSTSGSWGEVTNESTEIQMEFVLYNPKQYPISVSEIGYDIRMNNVSIGSGQTAKSYTLAPKETTTVEATTVLDTQKLDEWWVSHLQRDQVTELEIDFYMVFDLSAAGGDPVRIQFDTLTQTIETDFFGNKSDGSDTDGDSDRETTETPTDGTGGTATPTADDSTETATTGGSTETPTADDSTETATPTPTPNGGDSTETATDDGGLL